MNARNVARMLALLVFTGCGIFESATELQVINETGAALDVLAAPCGAELEPFAVLDDGESHTEEVDPGCWRIEGCTDDSRFGEVEVEVAEGALHKVPFGPEGAT